MPSEKLAVIIPTKDRPRELRRLLESMAGQFMKPEQIIIVDGGVEPVECMTKEFKGLNVDYLRVVPPSLTKQRNAGLNILGQDITLVGFLDDDVVMDKDSIGKMLEFWEKASGDTGGAGFNILDIPRKKVSFFEKVFMVNTDSPNRILKSGFQSRSNTVQNTEKVDWLVGCAMVWRKEVFGHCKFDEWFSGYARYEEVDFGYRVGRRYRLFIVGDARVRHLNSLEDLSFSRKLGRMQIVNRLYFVKKSGDLSIGRCYWACIGLIINNLIKGILRFDRRYLLRFSGNMAGLWAVLLSRHKGYSNTTH